MAWRPAAVVPLASSGLHRRLDPFTAFPASLAAAQACVPPPSDGEAPPGSGDNPVRVWLLNGTAENTFQLSPAASPRRGGRLAQAREQVEAAEADPLPPRLAAEGAAEAEDDDDDMSAEDDFGIQP